MFKQLTNSMRWLYSAPNPRPWVRQCSGAEMIREALRGGAVTQAACGRQRYGMNGMVMDSVIVLKDNSSSSRTILKSFVLALRVNPWPRPRVLVSVTGDGKKDRKAGGRGTAGTKDNEEMGGCSAT